MKQLTWDEVKKANPKMIFFSANTIWWTHDANDLQPGPVPLDVFGSPCLQTDAVREFFDEDAIKNSGAYGEADNAVATLMACHHRNIEWLRNHPEFHPSMSYVQVSKILARNPDVTAKAENQKGKK